MPEYPEAARARGLRGYAEVEFTVTPAGTVEGSRIVSAEPRNVFDAAALAAVARRRYPADAERAPQVVTERIEFAPATAAQTAAVGAGNGPLNQCVREDAVYNYGEMIDVGLINACTEPLMVFGCAQGRGRIAAAGSAATPSNAATCSCRSATNAWADGTRRVTPPTSAPIPTATATR